MMRMTKTVRGHYFTTPKTKEEVDLAMRWFAAIQGFRLPYTVQTTPMLITRRDGTIEYSHTTIADNFEHHRRSCCVLEAPKGSYCLVPLIMDELRLYRAWAAAFNAFMEEWERGDDEDEIASYYTQSDTQDEYPSQYKDVPVPNHET